MSPIAPDNLPTLITALGGLIAGAVAIWRSITSDRSQVVDSAVKLINELQEQAAALQTQVRELRASLTTVQEHNERLTKDLHDARMVGERVARLEAENGFLRQENESLRRRVMALEAQRDVKGNGGR